MKAGYLLDRNFGILFRCAKIKYLIDVLEGIAVES